jgi:hypothetical protein
VVVVETNHPGASFIVGASSARQKKFDDRHLYHDRVDEDMHSYRISF